MIKIQKYLPKAYYCQIKLKKCIIASIKKQNANQTILILKNIPTFFDQQSHLKRIRKIQENHQFVQAILCLTQQEQQQIAITNSLKEYIEQLKQIDIPINAPNTKEQYLQWSQYWPINFIEQEIYREIKHSQQELLFLQQCQQKQEQFIIFSDIKELYQKKQPKHCIEGTIQHPIMKLLQQWPLSKSFNSLPSAYYLTKLRLFCRIPICGMCAMALVHSRLQRIYFYGIQIPEETGAILCCQKLNHRIKIFNILSIQ